MNPGTGQNLNDPANLPRADRSLSGADAPAKQQITERLKQANNVLVTVAANPTLDQLAACIGFTLLLNKMGKHATAVFSGKVPSTIEFLEPQKTLETNTDSLRDFIISLDKAKADKLRYKVEDKFVRIFITPYRTSLSDKDLVFSQGDFNVEAVVALGIKDRNQIDAAITAHGRILHDATVISVNTGSGKAPDLGQINWQEPTASSLCEMLVSISEAFGGGLIDNQIATAFLTGIVAETSRFSNNKTSPKVMTMSAQLMAAGANQQLIVSKLEPPPPPPPKPEPPKPPKPKAPEPPIPPPAPKKKEGTLNVSHEPTKADSPEVEIDPNEIHIDEEGNLKTGAELKAEEEKQAKGLQPPPPLSTPPAPEPLLPVSEQPQEELPPLPPTPQASVSPAHQHPLEESPQSLDVKAKPTDDGHIPGPHELLNPNTHEPLLGAPFTANTQPEWGDPYNTVPIDPLSNPTRGNDGLFGHSPIVTPPEQQTNLPQPPAVNNARSAVESALSASPDMTPVQSLNASPLGPELHTPPANNGTPSLNLPSNLNGAASSPPPVSDMPPPAPPPAPPPLPFPPKT
jgi:hypothetical protein